MAGKLAAQRYAKALLSLATDSETVERVSADIRLVNHTIRDSRELQNLLKSPVVNDRLKKDCLKAVFKDAGAQTLQLFEVLIDNKRIGLLKKVTDAFIALMDKINNVTAAKVTTAVPMTEDLENKVMAKIREITGGKVTLSKAVDEHLIGGFLLRIGDLQYDASVSGKLNGLKYKFKQNAHA